MPSLSVHKDFQRVRDLKFCYLCGKEFNADDDTDHDHVPAKTTFNVRDRRQNVLKLKTHRDCNSSQSVDDKKAGQLIAPRRGEGPRSARDQALALRAYRGLGVAVENLNVDAAVWRWVKGFHAALYDEPLVGNQYALLTPFPRADVLSDGRPRVRAIREQDLIAVDVVKTNRAFGNLDSIVAYNRKLRYECVWCQADDGVRWLCCFGLDIYDWKDLGMHSEEIPARGCSGIYSQNDLTVPEGATLNRQTTIAIPNLDKLDPFAP
ncbi:MAG: hypothetical protein QNJ14_00960 [Woeseiaceae bacterium]|nr:hypothetical protein [Woeseiaceae bacterium]